MTLTNAALIAVAVVAILGAAGAFAVAYRRSQSVEKADPLAGVSSETRAADRSSTAVLIPPRVEEAEETVEEEAPEEEPEPAEAEEDAVVEILETQRIVEVSPEEGGVSRRQFFNRAIAATFGTFLAAQGLYYLAFFWPKLTGGFGADIDAGPITDLQTQVFTPDGAVLPLFIPEARAYLVPALWGAIRPVRGPGRGDRRPDGPLHAMCASRLPGAVVRPIAGIRVPVSRVEVQRHRPVFRRSRPSKPGPVRQSRTRAATSSFAPAPSSRRPGRRC